MKRFVGLLGVLASTVVWAGDAAEAVARMEALWPNRDTPEKLAELEKLAQEAPKAFPEDYEVLWRASRTEHWIADGAEGEKKRVHGKAAWELGEKAVARQPDRVEGNYFAAIGIGAYSESIGILRALTQGLEGKFNGRLDAALKLDPKFEKGGPWIAKGRYYFELPWPKRDLGKSAELYRKVVDAFPEILRAHLWLAETQLKDGQAKAASESLAKAEAGSVEYDPPEGRRVKEWAKSLRRQVEEELK